MKDKIKEAFNEFNPEEDQKQKMFYKIKDEVEDLENKHRIPFQKPIIALASLIMIIFIAMPVLASKSSYIYDLMYLVSPSVAQSFMPIEKSHIDNNIKMEVVSASIYENQVEVYITMKDLIENRIDETTDLYDSYSINRPFDSGASCEKVGFDKNTGTVTFLIIIKEWGNKEIKGDKITFTVGEFLSDRKDYSNINIPVDLSKIKKSNNTQKVSSFTNPDKGETVLVTTSKLKDMPIDEIDISSMGYINSKLHIQLEIPDRHKNDNYGFLYLKNKDGNIVEDDNYGIYFSGENSNLSYIEYVFDIPEDDIEDYSLYGDFKINRMRTEGNWRVTFPIEKINK